MCVYIYIYVNWCLHYPEEDGGELDEQGFAGVGQGVGLVFDLVGNGD